MNIRAVAAGCALAIAGAASPVGTACATGVAAPAASGVTAITASPMTASAAAASGTTATDPAVTQAPAAVRAALAQARLQGQGVLRWFGLKIYEARLWTGGESLDPARYEQAAFALDLRYARALDGAAIAQASHKEITRLGFGSAEQRAAWLDAMHRIFPDVTDGDRITGYTLRQPDSKRAAVQAFHRLNYQVVAAGDSYNDTAMLAEADAGILFRPPANVVAEFGQFSVTTDYEELHKAFLGALG
mgnify:CR=1 FL=1